MPRSTHRRTAVAALPLALVVLAGCGSRSSDAVAPQPPANSGHSSSAPVKPAATTVGGAPFLALLRHATEGITTARFTQTFDVRGQRIPVRGVIDLTGSTPAARMTMDLTGMGTPSQMVMVDGAVYVGIPGSAGQYYKVDLGDPNGPLAGLGSSLSDLRPSALMAQMSPRTFAHVTDHGVATVGGHRLHHYTAVLRPGTFKHLAGVPATALPKVAVYDVWLDDHGRMARFRMRMGRAGTMTGSYADYGLATHIVAPPASRVLPLPSTSTVG